MSLNIDAEIKLDSEPCVLTLDNDTLFVGTDTGNIIAFDSKLSEKSKWQAHAVQVFAITAADGKVYSSSNDGGVRIWSQAGEKIGELPQSPECDVISLNVYGSDLFIGDEAGFISIYDNKTLKANYNVLEEVKDIQFRAPYIFTVRDLDVTCTEIKPEESKTRFVTRHSMEGRAPIRVVGDKLLIVARGGNNIRLHYASVENEFKLLDEVKVSDMIVASLAVNNDIVWTGSWDGHVKKWKIINNKLEAAGDIGLGACVNGLAANSADCSSNSVYAAVAGGKVVRISSV